MLGLTVEIGGNDWSVADFRGTWAELPDYATEALREQRDDLGKLCLWIRDTLTKAKKIRLNELVGVPVEAVFDGVNLISWRVLEEVL